MQEQIQALLQEINAFTSTDVKEIDQFRIKYLSRNGIINDIFEAFKLVPKEQKRELGQLVNELKHTAEEKHKSLVENAAQGTSQEVTKQDYTLPAHVCLSGARHPISVVRNTIIRIFERIGFNISEGSEIVSDWDNFGALNFPEHHPARDMQDTFFVQSITGALLRTHTSSVQVQEMQKNPLPIRTISPGRVYRNETISARAHCQFHQVEGLYIDEGVSFADLKQTLYQFAKELFGNDTEIRFRPSFFPFTEPSAEMDISCFICKGTGCNICKGTGWVEILGCGMVDPNVLDNCGIDTNKYTGYAFGMGIERIAMLKYEIKDLRLYFENDIRFLKQFEAVKP